MDLIIFFAFLFDYRCILSVLILSTIVLEVFCEFSVDPHRLVRFEFGRKMKLDRGTPNIHERTQFSALISSMLLVTIRDLSIMMKKSPTLWKNRCFRYPAAFRALVKCWAEHLYRSNLVSSGQFFKGYRMDKHLEWFKPSAV